MIRLRVKELALAKGFNMSSLARSSGLGFSTVKRLWSDPYREVTVSTLEKIAKALNVATAELIEDVPDSNA